MVLMKFINIWLSCSVPIAIASETLGPPFPEGSIEDPNNLVSSVWGKARLKKSANVCFA